MSRVFSKSVHITFHCISDNKFNVGNIGILCLICKLFRYKIICFSNRTTLMTTVNKFYIYHHNRSLSNNITHMTNIHSNIHPFEYLIWYCTHVVKLNVLCANLINPLKYSPSAELFVAFGSNNNETTYLDLYLPTYCHG